MLNGCMIILNDQYILIMIFRSFFKVKFFSPRITKPELQQAKEK